MDQGAHRSALWLQGRELLAVTHQQIQGELSVGRIIFRPAWLERLAVARQGCRVDGKQDDKIVLLQGVHNRTLGQLQCDRNRTSKSFPQRAGPRLNLPRFVRDGGQLRSLTDRKSTRLN